jgi:hypothetical protein
MGFNKRMISKDIVMVTDESDLQNLLNTDGLIFDNWSFKFYELYQSGLPKDVAIEFLSNTGI